jgi:hypothetical protein
VKEIFDVLGARLRTPILGNFLLAVALLNWRAFFQLFFGDQNVDLKIEQFDESTSTVSLLWLPLLLGLIFSVLQPLIALLGSFIAYWPVHQKRLLQLKSDTGYDDQKQESELHRKRRLALVEEELIAKAKRDEEVASIDDNNLRLSLQRELDDLRQKELTSSVESGLKRTDWEYTLSPFSKELIVEAATSKNGEIIKMKTLGGTTFQAGSFSTETMQGGPELANYEFAIGELMLNGLIRDIGTNGEIFRLTKIGYDAAEILDQRG